MGRLCFIFVTLLVTINSNPLKLTLPNVLHLDHHKGRITLAWDVDRTAERITFEIIAKPVGWVGFGISPQGSMDGADIFIAGVDGNGVPYHSDRFGIGFTMPPIDDRDDWNLISAKEADGKTYLKFSRLFNTCDNQDFPITLDTNRLIWAMGDSDVIEYHTPERRGTRSISLLGAPTPKINTKKLLHWDMKVDMVMPSKRTSYWCTFHKGPLLPKKHHVVAFDSVVENESAEHHAHHYILYNCYLPPNSSSSLDQIFGNYTVDVGHPGNECYGPNSAQIPVSYCSEYLFVWAKDGKMMAFPENVGYPISDGPSAGIQQYYLLEIHFDNPKMEQGVHVKFGTRLHYTNKLRPIDAGLLTIGHVVDVSLTVPPNVKNYVAVGHCIPACTKLLPQEGITIFNVLLHSHFSGRALKLRHFRGNIELPPIDYENHFDFNYQQNKQLLKPVKILPGDHIAYECTYDSTWAKGRIVSGGMTTENEMCETFIWYYPKQEMNQCLSRPEMKEHMAQFGATGFHGTNEIGYPTTVIDEPENLRGPFDDVISAKFNWTETFVKEYTKKSRFGGKEAGCGSQTKGTAILLYNQTYPNNLVEYVVEDVCAKKI